MKINLIKKIILNNKLLILLFVILISCDSVGDSGNGDMQNIEPDNPTMQPAPTVSPTLQPPGAPPIIPPTTQPTQAPPVATPQPTAAPTIPPIQLNYQISR